MDSRTVPSPAAVNRHYRVGRIAAATGTYEDVVDEYRQKKNNIRDSQDAA